MKDLLKCPFCDNANPVTVYLDPTASLPDSRLPEALSCKCGARATKSTGCCKITYRWVGKADLETYKDVAHLQCVDCGVSYYAKVREEEGRPTQIGSPLGKPPPGIKIPSRRIVCGLCQRQGGKGARLNELIRYQASEMKELLGD